MAVISGTAKDDTLQGIAGVADTISAGDGNDVVRATGLDGDAVDGGTGYDVIDFGAMSARGLSLTSLPGGALRLASTKGAVAFAHVEELRFGDYQFFLDGRNNAPLANSDRVIVNEGATGRGSVLANDVEMDPGERATLRTNALAASGEWGTFTLGSDGTYAATAADALAAGEQATQTFQYTVRDARGGTSTSQVTVVLRGTNDAPVVAGDAAAVVRGGAGDTASGQISFSDVDHGADLTVAASAGTYGTVQVAEDGSYVYTRNANVAGLASGGSAVDHVAVTVRDEHGATATADIAVTVYRGVTETGTAGDDTLIGTGGNDHLRGLGLNDILEGGAGDDILDGGEFFDTASYASDTAGVRVDLVANTADGAQSGHDTLINIEDAAGGSGDDVLIGDQYYNQLSGADGDDRIFGGDGGGTLDGGQGNDVLVGGIGADRITGGAGDDVIDGGGESATDLGDSASLGYSWSGVYADLVTGAAIGAETGSDTLIGIEGLLGGTGDDLLYGNSGDNFLYGGGGDDRLDGRGGDDRLVGLRGDDRMIGGEGNDTFVVSLRDDNDGHVDIAAFAGGVGQGDVLELTDAHGSSFASIMSKATDVADGTLFTFDATHSILVHGIQKSGWAQDDLLLL